MTDLAPCVPTDRRDRVHRALRRAAPALLVYAGVRALGLVVLAGWSAANGKSAHTLLSARWDSLWYTRVAEFGYGWETRLPDGSVHSNLAFFPLLPWLERLGAAVSPLSYADAGLAAAWLASLAAALGIFLVAERLYGLRAGVCAVALWAVLPVGIVQSMAYSESLFTALAAWALYAVLRERWVTAGVLAALAGLTRPVGGAVVAALWVTAALTVARERRADRRLVVGVLLAPLGAAGYVLWVGHRTGDGIFGYLDVQAQWGNGFDGGLAFARFVGGMLTSFPSVFAGLGLIVGVGLVIWLYGVCVRQQQPPALLVYCGIVVVLALCASGYFGSKPRLLLPAFPLLLPLAVALARWRTRRAAALLAVVAAGSAVYGAFWLNGSGPP
ncbi:glycosyltransferase family 39 protein [Streptomyces sp. B-S-A8]|uniref:Glycosyltransferase family 39 protein n=1 Tax=Streptomyces solicavernae TaxID=3043614 RepID=A0ABT6RWX3_9ACTN|nr:glycosyltransferase family 39 protein [Streptomyces sp. B-S-A8]MDI3388830.1 glycosyltransferase family 39 protein [Streptomyces sp. B-S-A8]